MIKIEVINDVDIANWLKNSTGEVKQKAGEVILDTALSLVNSAVRDISKGGKSGKEYKVRGKTTRRSAEGEAPQTDSGNLVNSIKAIPYGNMNVEVVANTSYSWKLENEMNRPIFSKNLQEELPKMMNKIEKILGEVYG
jgi:hypothetical protein